MGHASISWQSLIKENLWMFSHPILRRMKSQCIKIIIEKPEVNCTSLSPFIAFWLRPTSHHILHVSCRESDITSFIIQTVTVDQCTSILPHLPGVKNQVSLGVEILFLVSVGTHTGLRSIFKRISSKNNFKYWNFRYFWKCRYFYPTLIHPPLMLVNMVVGGPM